MILDPPLADEQHWPGRLLQQGFAVLASQTLARLAEVEHAQWQKLLPAWDTLPPDAYLRDAGRYRRRRHGSLTVDASGLVTPVPHRAHWQPVDYNALHGGIERWFEPLPETWLGDDGFLGLIRAAVRAAGHLHPQTPRWFVEAHAFRIDCTDGIGRPTPEGAHRDGVDLVMVVLVARHAIRGAETRVFDAQGPQGMRFTLTEPFSALLLDDQRVIHESTPIQPLNLAQPGWRDTLVITCRRDGFQDPPPGPAAPPTQGATP